MNKPSSTSDQRSLFEKLIVLVGLGLTLLFAAATVVQLVRFAILSIQLDWWAMACLLTALPLAVLSVLTLTMTLSLMEAFE